MPADLYDQPPSPLSSWSASALLWSCLSPAPLPPRSTKRCAGPRAPPRRFPASRSANLPTESLPGSSQLAPQVAHQNFSLTEMRHHQHHHHRRREKGAWATATTRSTPLRCHATPEAAATMQVAVAVAQVRHRMAHQVKQPSSPFTAPPMSMDCCSPLLSCRCRLRHSRSSRLQPPPS